MKKFFCGFQKKMKKFFSFTMNELQKKFSPVGNHGKSSRIFLLEKKFESRGFSEFSKTEKKLKKKNSEIFSDKKFFFKL